MKDLLLYIARSLVEHPDDVTVTEKQGADELTLELRVAPDDMGKVIGRQGPGICPKGRNCPTTGSSRFPMPHAQPA